MDIPTGNIIETAHFVDGRVHAKRIIEGGYQMMSLPIPCAYEFYPNKYPFLEGHP